MNLVFRIVHFSPKDVVHENAIETIKALRIKKAAA